ncbi:MAG: chemotaxis protein CheW [Spirochaetota bacterium]
MSDYLDPNNEELLQDFFAEAESQVQLLESNILVLENDPSSRDAVDEIFRAAHTLKGASATVQMDELTEFTHLVEDVFDQIRNSSSRVTGELTDLLLSAVDIIKGMLDARASGSVYDGDHSAVVEGLRASVAGGTEEPASQRAPEPEPPQPVAPPARGRTMTAPTTLAERDVRELRENAEDDQTLYEVRVEFDESNPMNSVGGIQVFAALKQLGTVLRTIPDFDDLYSDEYHPIVTYFVASEADAAEIEQGVRLPDVTTGATVAPLRESDDETPTAERPATTELPSEGSTAALSEPSGGATPASASITGDATSEDETGEPDEATSSEAEARARGEGKRRSTPSSSVLRVDSRRVDNLLNLVSETVINKAAFNQVSAEFAESLTAFTASQEAYRGTLRELFDALPDYLERMQNGATAKEVKRELSERFGHLYSEFDAFGTELRQSVARFRSSAQNLGRITGELQEGVMRIRMVPISQIFSRFPRLVRDLTRSLNKNVALRIEGEDTELDKSVIEDLLDPLIHCVRNSIDHGIEAPADRVAGGKSEEGELLLRASSEGNMIIIEISDDGRGIDVDAVRQKAVDRGVIHPSKAISDIEAFNLIFDPGFSTAKQVSNISGRGVGLDVVRKQIEKLNGTVTVWSAKGEGTRFTIKIPLTLAIIQGLMVQVGSETYAIPITAVVESHRIKPGDIRTLDNYEVLNVRDDVVSLLRLSRIFRIETSEDHNYHFVVIVGSGDKKVGLIVDSLIGEEDVVIKPLRDRYTNAPGIAGANITGDGRVSLIIDVAQLLELGLAHERDARRDRQTVIGRHS